MAAALREYLGESLRAFRGVFGNPLLRRVELAWSGSIIGQWGYEVGLAVFAYKSGGATAVGVVGLVRMLPASIAAPFTALLGDRFSRTRVMIAADLVRAAALAGAGVVVFADGPAPVVYGLASAVAVAGTAFPSAQAALLPSLARTPDELAAANATSTTLESIGMFAGPALGGLVLALTSVGAVFVATASTLVWSAILVAKLPSSAAERPTTGAILDDALAGFRTIASAPQVRLVVGLYAAQTIVAGVLRVLVVATALAVLELGSAGVGVLNAAVGIGALAGLLLALAFIGRRRLAGQFRLGITLWGIPLVLLGIWPTLAGALLFLTALGVGNTLVDMAGLTLLQRATPREVLARVFGVLESLFLGTIGLGAILAPALIALLGTRGALIVAGTFLPVLAVVFWRPLTAIDRAAIAAPERAVELLRGIPIFAPLPALTLEQLASSLSRRRVLAGEEIFRQGDPGDRFYVIADGEVDVSVDGRRPTTLAPGGYFGEIALLRDVPRTATVTARTDAELYGLERDEFIAAVTGYAPSREAANVVVATRLARLGPVSTSL